MTASPTGKISLALTGAKKPHLPPKANPSNGIKRPHAALHDHDDEDDAHGHGGRAEVVSHFDRAAGGAIDVSKPVREEKMLVIAPRANRDWREASQRNKRQRALKVGREEGRNGDGVPSVQEEEKPSFGLNVFKRVEGDAPVVETAAVEDGQQAPVDEDGDAPVKEKTEDERAIDALLGKEEKTELVLPALTEEEAFARDFRDAPAMATLEDYERVPVEQFGAALLRGMGWKDGEGIGSQRGKKVVQTKVPERRPALLGIGAKEEAAVAQELGTWGKAAKDRKGPQTVYNPVLLRDKKTGELFTEEELEKKKQREEKEEYEREFERSERHKHKERRERDRDDSRERKSERKDGKRERSSERDRRKYDSDEEYYRRKEKEKRRRERERERGGSDYDRERSRRHDSDRDRHSERHRDRRR
ncbi:DExH-box splicing factor binding site-domain-containing protein [Neohortaea acidophila]|uniref:Pre-mRNA-splicing factor n=1 Tax=Neohortaea acidophila TaxID=245834 RepID=A0A6A6PN31_9PEZI|nr:DExH-box splicing factor binding site-domain-containing protein [Neohortaea acidophila]KAF2481044.1 DExH-box splicing factor binding site-domain-containing protein [Neohortaea acidophila]